MTNEDEKPSDPTADQADDVLPIRESVARGLQGNLQVVAFVVCADDALIWQAQVMQKWGAITKDPNISMSPMRCCLTHLENYHGHMDDDDEDCEMSDGFRMMFTATLVDP